MGRGRTVHVVTSSNSIANFFTVTKNGSNVFFHCNGCSARGKGTPANAGAHIIGEAWRGEVDPGRLKVYCSYTDWSDVQKAEITKLREYSNREARLKSSPFENSQTNAAASSATGDQGKVASATVQTHLDSSISAQRKRNHEKADSLWVQWLARKGLGVSVLEDPSFRAAIDATIQAGPGYVPPCRSRATDLIESESVVKQAAELAILRASARQTGCTITSDGCTDAAHRSVLNVLIESAEVVYLADIKHSGADTKDAKYIADLVVQSISDLPKDVGDSVVLICMDGACNAALKEIKVRMPNVLTSVCLTHSLDLLLKDVSKVGDASSILKVLSTVVNYICNHTKPREALVQAAKKMREASPSATKAKSLIKHCGTRFGTHYLSLERFLLLLPALREMCGLDWDAYVQSLRKRSDKDAAIFVKRVINDDALIQKMRQLHDLTKPMFVLMRKTDAQSSAAGDVWPMIRHLFAFIQEHAVFLPREVLLAKISSRWDYMVERSGDFLAAAFALSPSHRDKFIVNSDYKWHVSADKSNIFRRLEKVIKWVCGNDRERAERASMQYFTDYLGGKGDFADCDVYRDSEILDAPVWWDRHGWRAEALQFVALRILTRTGSASSCERNWKDQKDIMQGHESLLHRNVVNRVKLRHACRSAEKRSSIHNFLKHVKNGTLARLLREDEVRTTDFLYGAGGIVVEPDDEDCEGDERDDDEGTVAETHTSKRLCLESSRGSAPALPAPHGPQEPVTGAAGGGMLVVSTPSTVYPYSTLGPVVEEVCSDDGDGVSGDTAGDMLLVEAMDRRD